MAGFATILLMLLLLWSTSSLYLSFFPLTLVSPTRFSKWFVSGQVQFRQRRERPFDVLEYVKDWDSTLRTPSKKSIQHLRRISDKFGNVANKYDVIEASFSRFRGHSLRNQFVLKMLKNGISPLWEVLVASKGSMNICNALQLFEEVNSLVLFQLASPLGWMKLFCTYWLAGVEVDDLVFLAQVVGMDATLMHKSLLTNHMFCNRDAIWGMVEASSTSKQKQWQTLISECLSLTTSKAVLSIPTRPRSQDTICHIAAGCGNSQFISSVHSTLGEECLTQTNAFKQTPLHIAASRGFTETAATVACLQPDILEMVDAAGRTPLDVASDKVRRVLIGVVALKAKTETDSIDCKDVVDRFIDNPWKLTTSETCNDDDGGDGSVCRATDDVRGDFELLSVESIAEENSSLNANTFLVKYYSTTTPVVIRGGCRDWAGLTKWTPEHMERILKEHKLKVGQIPYSIQFGKDQREMTIRDYFAHAKDMNSTHPFYIFDNLVLNPKLSPIPRATKALMKDMENPVQFNIFKTTSLQFMAGIESTGAPLHYHQDAWNCLIKGEKRWLVYPPSQALISTQHAVETFNSFTHCHVGDGDECKQEEEPSLTQYEGDLVYIPQQYTHAVINKGITFAVASEFILD
eukprot:m.18576 g.18576  ORF g.18576 m.18576 type:complete len:632 (+) comp4980_c0_seq1:56-1951(+)